MFPMILALATTMGSAVLPACPEPVSYGTIVSGAQRAASPIAALATGYDPAAMVAEAEESCIDTHRAVVVAPVRRAALGEDKLAHAAVSFALTTSLHASARIVGMSRDPALAVGAGVAALVGVAKEWRDRRNGEAFDVADLAFDALGIAVGMLLLTNVR